jgi:hypothetical protein
VAGVRAVGTGHLLLIANPCCGSAEEDRYVSEEINHYHPEEGNYKYPEEGNNYSEKDYPSEEIYYHTEKENHHPAEEACDSE